MEQSFLHHMKLGGLQVLLPNSEQWAYVKVRPLRVSILHAPYRDQVIPFSVRKLD